MSLLDTILGLDRKRSPWDFGVVSSSEPKDRTDTNMIERKWSTQVGGGGAPDFGTAWLIGALRYDNKFDPGDLVDSSAVMACVGWVMRAVSEAPVHVKQKADAMGAPLSQATQDEAHPLTALLKRPNPYYGGRLLWRATAMSYNLDGNAYWIKWRGAGGRGVPAAIYYEPHYTIRPRGSKDELVSYYEVWRDGRWQPIPKESVVHFRNGLDPRNPMKGISLLSAALREVFTDNQAGLYSAAMMRNLGVPPLIISPKPGEVISDPQEVKTKFVEKTTGEHRGEPLVLGDPVDIQMLSFPPSNMDTRDNRKISEERISALLGVPAIVAGLGAGLERSTFANMAEAREMAYESNIIPTLNQWADDMDGQLLTEFPQTTPRHFIAWDLSGVRVLQDDMNKLAERTNMLYQGGIIKLNEARTANTYPEEKGPEGDTYKSQPASIPAEQALPTGPPPKGKDADKPLEQKEGPQAEEAA